VCIKGAQHLLMLVTVSTFASIGRVYRGRTGLVFTTLIGVLELKIGNPLCSISVFLTELGI
jgi:hypothetical protein